MEDRIYVMSPEYREEMQDKFARDFWFMCTRRPDPWEVDFNWHDICFEMEWGNGWLRAFYDLCRQLLTEVKSDFQWTQLKEKFGTARCYYGGGITPYGVKLIEEFEKETAEICEHCGEPGKIYNDGWMMCLCDKCEEKSREY